MSRPTGAPTMGSMDARTIAAIRPVLALSAMLILCTDPPEPGRYPAFTCAALILYTVYSAILYLLALRRPLLFPARVLPWIDVGWYLMMLVVPGSGRSRIFFLFFPVPILMASLDWGVASGLCVALACATPFLTVGLATAPGGPDSQLLLGPTYLILLGAMMACWGGSETRLRLRLELLKEIGRLSNPRFGVDRTIGSILERLRAFYDADACLFVVAAPTAGGLSMRRADRRNPEAAMRAEPIPEGLADPLLALPAGQAVVCRGEPRLGRGWRAGGGVRAYDVATGRRVANPPEMSGVLEAESFLTVPFGYDGKGGGRLYLLAPRRCDFDAPEVDFLLQVLGHTLPAIDTLRLVDRLASDAAGAERRRIARDLHDSVIQPYLGLQMGLAALRQKLASGSAEVKGEVERLISLTEVGLDDLRHYTGALREGDEPEGGLLPAVRRFAGRFAEATGIAVHVEAGADLCVNDRLAAEVFQMVAEGLSNIRRHTGSRRATVGLACSDGHLVLRVGNDVPAGAAPVPFIPRSITERATALGGRGRVEWTESGDTVVIVEIPL
ncbi:MAG: hypothetical protein HYS70_01455 [Nitrospinae bacterium]|nr:hypothetical protein [Nitrospinota bacterium]